MKRLKTLAFVIVCGALIAACTQPTAPVGPKFSGRVLLLAGDKTSGADLVELSASPTDSTYNFSIVTKGVFDAAASPDRSRLVYATRDGILLRDFATSEVKILIKGQSGCLVWAPDGKHFSYKQGSNGERATLYASDLDGKSKLIWEDLVTDQGAFGCPHWVAPDRIIFDRFLGGAPRQKKSGEALKPNTTTMAILGDSLKLIDIDRKWLIEGICSVGSGAFLRSVDQNELLIEDAYPIETVFARRHSDKDEIEFGPFELLLDRRTVVLDEGEANLRMGRVESTYQLGDVCGTKRTKKSQGNRPAICLRQIDQLTPAVLDLAERALDPHQEQFAVAGQSERATDALVERNAHVGLQPCQRPAQGRLAGSKLLGGARDVLETSGDAEGFKQVPIDFGHRTSRATSPWAAAIHAILI